MKCRYKYVKLKTGDTYEFLPAEEVEGMEARLSPDYNAVSVTCRRVGPPFLLVLNWLFLIGIGILAKHFLKHLLKTEL